MEGIRTVNKWLHQYCDERGIHYYDPYGIFLGGKWEDLFQDHIHPSEHGYQLWGESIVEKLGKMIH